MDHIKLYLDFQCKFHWVKLGRCLYINEGPICGIRGSSVTDYCKNRLIPSLTPTK